MLRKIVLLRGHERLRVAWQSRAFSMAASTLDQSIKVQGAEFDESYHPVRVPGPARFALSPQKAVGFDYRALALVDLPVPGVPRVGATYAVRAKFKDQEAIERLKQDRADEVVGVFADPTITAFPAVYCGNAAVGTDRDAWQQLGGAALRKAGLTGKKVRVAVVDTGIDAKVVPVAGGWGPTKGYKPGSVSPPQHGTMCAFDVRIAAPDAQILDYALLQSAKAEEGWAGFLSDALAAFADLIDLLQKEPGPLVVNNSWGMFNRSQDEPIGSPGNYSANPDHPFNQIVGSLVAAGADVCFAAGNCGDGKCKDVRCGKHDVGPGQSIHGANSHPDVITVAAVTVDQRRLGYSSQGPGGLFARKPDLAGYSHFLGSKVEGADEPDSGTSTASPVVAGVVAALRQRLDPGNVSPASLKSLLQRSAKDLGGKGWDRDLGYGVIDAAAALKSLDSGTGKKKAASVRTSPRKGTKKKWRN